MAYTPRSRTLAKLVRLRARHEGVLHAAQLRWLDYSTGHRLFHVFRNELGAEVGYIVWAHFSDESVLRLARNRQYPVYEYEWIEGITHFILDVSFQDGRRRLTRADLDAAFVRDVDKIAYVKRDRLQLLRRVGDRFRRVGVDRFVR